MNDIFFYIIQRGDLLCSDRVEALSSTLFLSRCMSIATPQTFYGGGNEGGGTVINKDIDTAKMP